MKKYILIVALFWFCMSKGQDNASFSIFDGTKAVAIIYDDKGTALDSLAAHLLAEDIERVTGTKPSVKPFSKQVGSDAILIGNINSAFIRSYVTDVVPQRFLNQKESFYQGVSVKDGHKNFIIAGTDARGTAFGVFNFSEKIGVNPWYWWADVPVKKQSALNIPSKPYFSNQPTVEYRGIFLNDEDWGLQPWAAKTFEKDPSDIGPKTYAKIFELLLRLKANAIWPAMHPSTKAFFYYPGNVEMAKLYNIVVGTSHAEPMLRNNVDEWKEGFGKFDYKSNKKRVADYWEQRVKEAKGLEASYTIGMRGVHDSGMEGVSGIEEASAVLANVIKDQRDMLQRNLGMPAAKVPQVFTVYKEVLQLYEHGIQLPEDITLVWTDDNYGYIRQLSNAKEQLRPGGAGVYYHISYWGRPHDYLWLCTTPPELIAEEMLKAYHTNANKIWIVNVGDIKPGEYDTQLFLDMAYDITPFLKEDYVQQHTADFYSSIFGNELGEGITAIKKRYYTLAYERKPEYMGWSQTEPTTKVTTTAYNPFAFGDEVHTRINDYTKLGASADSVYRIVPQEYKDAYFQLVQYPVKGAMFMNYKHLYRDLALKYNEDERLVAAAYKNMSLTAYDSIGKLTDEYNRVLANGKWNHMMSLAPRDLPVFNKPEITLANYDAKEVAGFKIEGCNGTPRALPTFYAGFNDTYFIDVFLKKEGIVKWKLHDLPKWILVSKKEGTLNSATNFLQERIEFKIDWKKYANSKSESEISVLKLGKKAYPVKINIARYPTENQPENSVYEKNGFAVAYAKNYIQKQGGNGFKWFKINNLGYSGELMQATPLNALPLDTLNVKTHPKLSYVFITETVTSTAELIVAVLPTHPLTNKHKVKIGVQWDDNPVQIVNFQTFDRSETWKQNVLSNLATASLAVNLTKKDNHTLTIYMIDQGVCLDFIYLKTKDVALPYTVLPETKQ
ncbi:hypothetical protein FMM05_11980 [Flavobacterium zepuense]|uniref:Gylcosyl hydrolase 115 C-terminal domain-containing protein n=1 Tax=Flavobacterium zepuense TaxID=2593302 RepID=A0A552V071_9FLAO|nr:glycosyl hydrolase 115 family protein [Flavobacterium zepuense]TRW23873.1 hypothetical protein FMM05_11980 [Flavobacterium zepuense]